MGVRVWACVWGSASPSAAGGACRPNAHAKKMTGNTTSWVKVPRTTRHRGYPSVHSADCKETVGVSAARSVR